MQQLISELIDRGYRVVGPSLSGDGNAIVLAELTSADDLPRGWGVDVAPGHYRLRRRDDDALFGHSAGAQSWKQFLHPPRQKFWSGTSDGADTTEPQEIPRYAFIGVRACDLSAIAILNGVLGVGAYPDQGFVARRRKVFVVAVNCTEPGGLCFCTSMGAGPAVGPGYDLALTERIDGDGCRYVVDVGSADGAAVLAAVARRDASATEIDAARREVADAANKMGRQMPYVRHLGLRDLRELLIISRESPRSGQHHQSVPWPAATARSCARRVSALTIEDTLGPEWFGRASPTDFSLGTRASKSGTPTCTDAAPYRNEASVRAIASG